MVPSDNLPLGKVGSLQLSFSGGKAVVALSLALPGGVAVDLQASDDAGALIDQLAAIVEKALPSTAAIDMAVFGVIKAAVQAIQ